MTANSDPLQKVLLQTRDLVSQLHALAADVPQEERSAWVDCAERVDEVAQVLESSIAGPLTKPLRSTIPLAQLKQFGQLLRDKRNAAGLSRIKLARQAKISDATIKFLETARHPPSRATLIRLIAVEELRLTWADVPGQPSLPHTTTKEEPIDPLGPTALDGGPVFLVLHRLDFDELGDPVFVRRARGDLRPRLPGTNQALETRSERDEELQPLPGPPAETEFVPLRR